MNKSELREVKRLAYFHAHDMDDTVARGLSALIRCATKKSAGELRDFAEIFGVTNHPEFII